MIKANGERTEESSQGPARAGVSDLHRPLLFSIAYRMLGNVMGAEDVVQEAYLRWQRVSETEVRSPRAYLSAVVTRLCIDQLRSVKRLRQDAPSRRAAKTTLALGCPSRCRPNLRPT